MELLQIAALLLILLVALLAGGLVDRHHADRLRFRRHAVRRCDHPAWPGAGDHDLGQQRVLDARRAAAVHLDGRNPVPHAVVGGDVPRSGAVAELAAGTADARQRAGLRDIRIGVGLVRRDHGDRRQDRAARIEEARLRPDGEPWLARRGRDARHSHPAVDHDGDLRGAGERLDHPGVPGGLHPRPDRDGAVLRLHHRLVAAQSEEAAAAASRQCRCAKSSASRRSSAR